MLLGIHAQISQFLCQNQFQTREGLSSQIKQIQPYFEFLFYFSKRNPKKYTTREVQPKVIVLRVQFYHNYLYLIMLNSYCQNIKIFIQQQQNTKQQMKVFIALLLILPSLALYMKMNTRLCFGVEETMTSNYRFQFESNSNTTDNVTLSIVNKEGATIIHENRHSKQMEIPGHIAFTICFINDDSETTYISMDLWTSSSDNIKSLATKGDLHQLHSQMRFLSEGIKNISRGQKFQQQRQDLHSMIILGFENKIKWMGTTKILLIITLAIAQILILRYTLNNDDKLTI